MASPVNIYFPNKTRHKNLDIGRFIDYSEIIISVRHSDGRDSDTSFVSRRARRGFMYKVQAGGQDEVVEMFLTDYDFEEHMRMEREENYAYGHADGKAEGIAEGIAGASCDI